MSGDVPAPSMYEAPPDSAPSPIPPPPPPQPLPQAAPQVILQPIRVPQPIPMAKMDTQRNNKKDFTTFYTIMLLIFIFFASLIVIYFTLKQIYDTKYDIELIKKVKMFPNHDGMGDIQLFNLDNDDIGIIDGHNFGIREAHVICKQFGFSERAHAYTLKETFKSKIKPDFILRNLNCQGDESKIEHCSYDIYEATNLWQTRLNIAGVVCVSKSKQKFSRKYNATFQV